MKVLTFLNEKGGVGKTTLSIHAAAGAALKDLRVLLIDGDTQGHCAQQLGIETAAGLYDLLVKQARWGAVVHEAEAARWIGREATIGRLLVLPSDINTRIIPLEMDHNAPLLLRERLSELNGSIDLVVIDTAPTPTLLQSVIMLATDYVIYPTKCEALSLDGLAKSTQHMAQMDAMRAEFGIAPLRMLGVVPTMFENTQAHIHGRNLLEAHFGEQGVWEPVPRRTIWQQREYSQQTMYAYAPLDEAAQLMRQMVKRILNAMQIEPEGKHA